MQASLSSYVSLFTANSCLHMPLQLMGIAAVLLDLVLLEAIVA